MNTKKTKVIAENVENPEIRTLDGTVLEVVKDFNYFHDYQTPSGRDT